MPSIIDSTLWEFLAAASILILLSSPFLILFFFLSIRKSLWRIAEALEQRNYSDAKRALESATNQPVQITPFEGKIYNSGLGR
jgi:hypothetical protein